MTEETGSYSIEIKDEASEALAIFTFPGVTAEELQILLADFRRVLREKSATFIVNRVAPSID